MFYFYVIEHCNTGYTYIYIYIYIYMCVCVCVCICMCVFIYHCVAAKHGSDSKFIGQSPEQIQPAKNSTKMFTFVQQANPPWLISRKTYPHHPLSFPYRVICNSASTSMNKTSPFQPAISAFKRKPSPQIFAAPPKPAALDFQPQDNVKYNNTIIEKAWPISDSVCRNVRLIINFVCYLSNSCKCSL